MCGLSCLCLSKGLMGSRGDGQRRTQHEDTLYDSISHSLSRKKRVRFTR